MTTRYVGPGGSDANSGLTWALRKLTLNGVEDTPVVAGDTIYVGPGTYRETLTVDVSGTAGIPAGTSVLLTNNPGKYATGGTCFGDSGGPVFWGDSNVIVAVNSFVLNSNCKGLDGGYRVDTTDDQEWINTFLD